MSDLNIHAEEFVPMLTSSTTTMNTPSTTTTTTQADPHPQTVPAPVSNTVQTIRNPYATHAAVAAPSPNPVVLQRQHFTQLRALFPSIASSKLDSLFQSNASNLKKSILRILQDKSMKGEYDQHICVYHLSHSCQYESKANKCRYNHDREVPSAICQFWLNDACIKSGECTFLHRIPASKHASAGPVATATASKELVLMLTAMFPRHSPQHLEKLLGRHAMDIKPVVATLLQGDDYSVDNNADKTQSSSSAAATETSKSDNERPVCRYFLMGDCKLLDCMFVHDASAASAVCKYYLWGYCSRGNKCIYKHCLPQVDTHTLRLQQQQHKEMQQQQKLREQQRQQQPQRLNASARKPKKPPSDLVAKLRLSCLKESFPQIPAKELTAAFTAKQYDLEATQQYLRSEYGHQPMDVAQKKTTAAGANAAFAKKERANVDGKALMNKIGWVETGDSLNALYKTTRTTAEQHARIRNQLFMNAVDAYLKGNKKLAKELSTRGREHDQQMHALHKQAAGNIYEQRNAKLALSVIDLHGLHCDEGIKKLETRLSAIRNTKNKTGKKRKRRNAKNKQSEHEKNAKQSEDTAVASDAFVLDILTGTGHHSFGGRAKLGPAIIAWAKQKKIKYKKMTFVDGRGGNIRLFIV